MLARIPKIICLSLSLLGATNAAFAFKHVCKLPKNITTDYYNEIIYIKNPTLPQISLIDSSFEAGASSATNTLPNTIGPLQMRLGVERKRPFIVVSIPTKIYQATSNTTQQLTSITLEITEQAAPQVTSAQKTTATTQSVLATGTWYKLGVTQTGFHKITKSLLNSIGINTDGLNTNNIRIFGNGGAMLSEDNRVNRPDDLLENALWVNDGGDQTMNDNDFIIFYAQGTTAWIKDSVNQRFKHQNNLYADTSYYFITVDNGPGLRVQQQTSAPTSNITATNFNYRMVFEQDLVSPISAGKSWYGSSFLRELANFNQSFNFNLGTTVGQMFTTIAVASTSKATGSNFNITLNGAPIINRSFGQATVGSRFVTHQNLTWQGDLNSSSANFNITFTPALTDSRGYLDYIAINGRGALQFTGDQFTFRDWQTTGAGKIAQYVLQNANDFTQVWDVTTPNAPIALKGTLTGSNYSCSQDASYLHEFAAFRGLDLPTPIAIGNVPNQNLHAAGAVDLIIVAHPKYMEPAQKVADFHTQHDHLNVRLVTTQQVYNEFASGRQDISAIRDFARMFYKRAGTDTNAMPKYLCLFGGASYDYKYRINQNCNYVPTFETLNDSDEIYTYSSDDFYGFLDDSENMEDRTIINALDIGVGRIPARTLADANAVANKIINYKSTGSLGPWRLNTLFVADDNDGAGNHLDDAETMARTTNTFSKNLSNIQKVYVNAIPTISTPAGLRCPNANVAINDQIYKGLFMVNYNGHGNPQVWAGERILTQDDFNTWDNLGKLPFMVTATCDFGQFDRPQQVSAAELLLNKADGGVIAMVTTTQAVYAFYNNPMNMEYLTAQYTKNSNGKWNTFGDALRKGKNMTFITSRNYDEFANFNKFALLGDPALTPNFPENNVVLDSLLDGITGQRTDTLKALGKYTIKGSIKDYAMAPMTQFTGSLYVSIYDKPRTINTLTGARSFKMQDNLIYKGKVSVVNGKFAFSFITPKDINYNMGIGKISTYAENGVTDAAGSDTSIAIGGFSANPQLSNNGPEVAVFINDSNFISGGITGTNSKLYIQLKSETGINVSGYTVGHDLLGILDDNQEQPYLLNDYYETAPNTYQRGFVTYPLQNLANGNHHIRVRAWDANNNMGEGEVYFTVVEGKVVSLEQLGNYPNPFSNTTHFVFEHNHPEENLSIEINVYSLEGKLVKTIQQPMTPTGSRTLDIVWDGTGTDGALLVSGMYMYQLKVTTNQGISNIAYQKLIITR